MSNSMRKIQVIIVMMLLFCMGICGYAVATAGTSDDPLITQSYLEQVLTPQLEQLAKEQVQQQMGDLTDQFDVQLTLAQQSIASDLQDVANDLVSDADFAAQVAAYTGTDSDGWRIYTLSAGQTLQIAAGAEVIVRSGTVVSSVELVDVTAVSRLTAGTALTANNYYKAASIGGTLTANQSSMLMVYGA